MTRSQYAGCISAVRNGYYTYVQSAPRLDLFTPVSMTYALLELSILTHALDDIRVRPMCALDELCADLRSAAERMRRDAESDADDTQPLERIAI